MAFNYTDMLGNMFGGMAKSLGYGDMVIQPRKPNGPPTKQLLPSEIAAGDMMHGMNAGMEDMQMPSMQATHSMLPHLLSYHAYGGPLDPRKINIVGEQGPEAIVGQQVIPLDQQIVNREQGQIMQPPVQQIVNSAPAQMPLPLGLAQTEEKDDSSPNVYKGKWWDPNNGMPLGHDMPQGNTNDNPDALRQQIMETLQGSTKRSPWADLGVSLVQAGDNWFNKKNEPIKTWAQIQADKKLRGLLPQYQLAQEAQAQKAQQAYTQARMRDMDLNRQIQQGTLEERRDYHKTEAEQKATKMANDAANLKMRLLARQWEHLGAYNPNDPKFAELTKGLGEVNLPLTPKDAKKLVKYEQDAETGAWNMTLTDPYTKEQETRPITTKDGKQLVTTSSSKVMSTAAGERQDKALGFNREKEAALNTYRQAFLGLKQQEINLRQQGQTRAADDAARRLAAFKSTLQMRVKSGQLTADDADSILRDMGEDIPQATGTIGMGEPQQ